MKRLKRVNLLYKSLTAFISVFIYKYHLHLIKLTRKFD